MKIFWKKKKKKKYNAIVAGTKSTWNIINGANIHFDNLKVVIILLYCSKHDKSLVHFQPSFWRNGFIQVLTLSRSQGVQPMSPTHEPFPVLLVCPYLAPF